MKSQSEESTHDEQIFELGDDGELVSADKLSLPLRQKIAESLPSFLDLVDAADKRWWRNQSLVPLANWLVLRFPHIDMEQIPEEKRIDRFAPLLSLVVFLYMLFLLVAAYPISEEILAFEGGLWLISLYQVMRERFILPYVEKRKRE